MTPLTFSCFCFSAEPHWCIRPWWRTDFLSSLSISKSIICVSVLQALSTFSRSPYDAPLLLHGTFVLHVAKSEINCTFISHPDERLLEMFRCDKQDSPLHGGQLQGLHVFHRANNRTAHHLWTSTSLTNLKIVLLWRASAGGTEDQQVVLKEACLNWQELHQWDACWKCVEMLKRCATTSVIRLHHVINNNKTEKRRFYEELCDESAITGNLITFTIGSPIRKRSDDAILLDYYNKHVITWRNLNEWIFSSNSDFKHSGVRRT